ncbi:MAG: disulfide bond formation protein B [Burkholderiales bacterium]
MTLSAPLAQRLRALTATPRQVAQLLAAGCGAALATSLFVQHVLGLAPCTLCMLQRLTFTAVLLLALPLAWSSRPGGATPWLGGAIGALGLTGTGIAAYQVWLQTFARVVPRCGRGLSAYLDGLPLGAQLNWFVAAEGDCSKPVMLVGSVSMAELGLVAFVLIAIAAWRMVAVTPTAR